MRRSRAANRRTGFLPRKEAQFIRLSKHILSMALMWSHAFGWAKSPSTSQVKASFYADAFENRPMAGGGRFHQRAISAASLQYPLGTTLKLTSIKTNQSIIVIVTDRGPWTKRYQLDLSKAAFKALGLDLRAGWGWVTVQVVSPENFPEEAP